jgi:mannonate dehydratase
MEMKRLKMTFRWFGERNDSITLDQIRQIPGVSGVAGTLSDIPAGQVLPYDAIKAYKDNIEAHGIELEVIESVNVKAGQNSFRACPQYKNIVKRPFL